MMAWYQKPREGGGIKKIFNLKGGMAVGMKLVCIGSNEIRDEIHMKMRI